jgi:hypothetical protein
MMRNFADCARRRECVSVPFPFGHTLQVRNLNCGRAHAPVVLAPAEK